MAQVSDLGEDVFGARSAECGLRRAAGGCLRSAAGVRSAECGRPVSAEPAGVCRAGRCLRSAECELRSACGSCGVRTADCGAGRYPRSADRGVLRTHADYGVLLFN